MSDVNREYGDWSFDCRSSIVCTMLVLNLTNTINVDHGILGTVVYIPDE